MMSFVEQKRDEKRQVQASTESVAQRQSLGFIDNRASTQAHLTLQRAANRNEKLLQGRFQQSPQSALFIQSFSTTASASIQQKAPKANITGLPDNLKSGMENLSRHSLDHVKVHYNSSKPATVQARAYAQGSHIHLASGQEKHLPHELGHVVQQIQGRVRPTTTVGGMAVNDNIGLENEATLMGQQALQRAVKQNESKSGTEIAPDHVTTSSMTNAEYAQFKENTAGSIKGLHGAHTVGDTTYVSQFHDPAAVMQMMGWRDKMKIALVALEGILTIAAGIGAAVATGGVGVIPAVIASCVGVAKCGRAYLMYDVAVTKNKMQGATSNELVEYDRHVASRTQFIDAIRALEALGALVGGGILIGSAGLTSKAVSLLIFSIAKTVRAATTAFSNYLDPKNKLAKKILDSISSFCHVVEVLSLGFASGFTLEAADTTATILGGASLGAVAASKGARAVDQSVTLKEKHYSESNSVTGNPV